MNTKYKLRPCPIEFIRERLSNPCELIRYPAAEVDRILANGPIYTDIRNERQLIIYQEEALISIERDLSEEERAERYSTGIRSEFWVPVALLEPLIMIESPVLVLDNNCQEINYSEIMPVNNN